MSKEKLFEVGQEVTLPLGTTINLGPSEDSDPYVLTAPTQFVIIGEKKESAIAVKIINPDKTLREETFYWHQPD